MRRGLVVCLLACCGGRTNLSTAPIADAQVPPVSNAYEVIYATNAYTLVRWRSHDGSMSTLNASSIVRGIACTYDGSFVAVARADGPTPTIEVLDRNGVTARVQSGLLLAIRPDGQRLMVAHASEASTCEGTLDADGTFAHERCFTAQQAVDLPVEYAPDGHTVLWTHDVYDPSTTQSLVSLVLADEDGSGAREILPPDESRLLSSVHFSFDGSRVTYLSCSRLYDETQCDIDAVDLVTLEKQTLLHEQYADWAGAAQSVPDGEHVAFVIAPDPSKPTFSSLDDLDVSTSAVTTLSSNALYYPNANAFCVMRD